MNSPPLPIIHLIDNTALAKRRNSAHENETSESPPRDPRGKGLSVVLRNIPDPREQTWRRLGFPLLSELNTVFDWCERLTKNEM
jgi:hypothetical protein